jgi:O-antigen ligase
MKGLLFTYGLTYGGAVVSLIRPFDGFLIYVAFSILKPDALWHWSVPAGNYSRIIAIALLAGWLLRGLGNWNLGKAWKPVGALMLFWAIVVIGGLRAPDQNRAWVYIEGLSKTFLPFLVGITLVDSVGKLKQLAWVILLCQGYLAFEHNLTYLSGSFDSDNFHHGPWDNNGVAIAMVTVIGLGFFLGLYADKWWQKGIAFFMVACMIHMVLFSMSRGGLLALMITGTVTFILIPKQLKHYLAFAVMLAVAIRLAGPPVMQRFDTSFRAQEVHEQSAELRILHWKACRESIRSEPLGVGPAQWPVTGPRYGLPAGMAAHSTWFQVGAEDGIPGLLCLAGFYAMLVLGLWPITRDSVPVPDPWMHHLARMVIASILGFAAAAQFVSIEGLETPYYIGLLGAGVLKLHSQACVDEHAMALMDDHGFQTATSEMAS